MPRLKGDIEIGYRAADEFFRLAAEAGVTQNAFEIRTGIQHSSIANWRYGATPGGLALQVLLRHGADVEYILSGKRKPKGGT